MECLDLVPVRSSSRKQEASKVLKLRFELIVEQDGDRLYGRCEALKGFHVDGANEAELEKNAIEALLAYLDSLKLHNEPLPVGCIVRERAKPSLLERAVRHFSPPRKIELSVAA